jgi:A/G-specific adenine glycosylase
MPRTGNSKFKIQNSKLTRLVPALLDWFSRHARDLPWRRTRDPYAIWVSEIMLQQTQVKTVLPYWERWMRELPSIHALARATPDKIHKLWEGLGYYTRVRNLQRAAQVILEKHHGIFPSRFDEVLALPGIGRYTAGAICSIAFNQPTPILDGNVIRVLTRLFGMGENPREKATNARLWQLADALVRNSKVKAEKSKRACSLLNQSVMELGATLCTPRVPQCHVCPVKHLCFAFRENRVAQFPNPGERVAVTARRFTAFAIERNGRFLIRQRPAGVVNAHLWEFPNSELNGESDPQTLARAALGFVPKNPQPLCRIKHSITRYRMTLDVLRAAAPASSPARSRRLTAFGPGHPSSVAVLRRVERPALRENWLTLAEMKKLAFPSAHRKIVNFLNNVGVR